MSFGRTKKGLAVDHPSCLFWGGLVSVTTSSKGNGMSVNIQVAKETAHMACMSYL